MLGPFGRGGRVLRRLQQAQTRGPLQLLLHAHGEGGAVLAQAVPLRPALRVIALDLQAHARGPRAVLPRPPRPGELSTSAACAFSTVMKSRSRRATTAGAATLPRTVLKAAPSSASERRATTCVPLMASPEPPAEVMRWLTWSRAPWRSAAQCARCAAGLASWGALAMWRVS